MTEGREFSVTTPLGSDVLLFDYMSGQDEIGRCFQFELGLLSEDLNITADQILGKPVTVSAQPGGLGETRYFNGLVSEFRLDEITEGYAHYVAIVKPWLWFLSLSEDCKIFQNLSIPDIIEEVFSEYGTATYEVRLQGSYDPVEFCVQFNESDLNFVERLMQKVGIFYYFEHADGEHTLVLTNDVAALESVPGFAEIPFRSDESSRFEDFEAFSSWSPIGSVTTGEFTHTDYDFTKPAADLMTKSSDPQGHDGADAEIYRYPGIYHQISAGDALAVVHRQEVQAIASRIRAKGTIRGLWSGALFSLTNHPRDAENAEFCVLRCEYKLWGPEYRSDSDREGVTFEISLVAQPSSLPYSPPRTAPIPVSPGPQTATVVGPGGEEIFTDEYSRVKVQFHWDRIGGNDENSSCFVRVSSAWAGTNWGFIQIPRIGQEVIVDFLDGDPDKPIITGRVYNAANRPPYELPGNATQSGWKSNSSPGGGGFNELRFEDKAGSEEVYFQAQKDHTELIKNDENRTVQNNMSERVDVDSSQSIGNNRTEDVGNDKSTTVGNNRSVSIGTDDTESVGSNRSLSVGADETISVGSNSSETIGSAHSQTVGTTQTVNVGAARFDTVGAAETRNVGGAQTQTVGIARAVTVGAAQSHNIGAIDSWEIGAAQTVNIGASQSVDVGAGQTVSVGADQTNKITGAQSTESKSKMTKTAEACAFDIGSDYALTAKDSIVLKCGSASIAMKKDGTINIEGKDITINGKGAILTKATKEVTIKGSKINQN